MPEALYQPLAPDYLDPAVAHAERVRTFQICADCRLCVRYCFSFKSLFNLIDDKPGSGAGGFDDDHHEKVYALTDAEHERVVDECFQCKLCYVQCPYTVDNEEAEWKVDFPALMLRSLVIRNGEKRPPKGARLLARTDLQGKLATTFSPLVNTVAQAKVARGPMEFVTGISRERLLPTFAKVRFSKWFTRRGGATADPQRRATVAMFPTCLVEYQEPGIGQALVQVYERNGIECTLPEGEVCCGMPWLDAGDATKFREHAEKNVALLAPAVRHGHDVVVPQPTCAYVLKKEYPEFLGTEDARLVGAHTFDSSEYLMARHRERPLDEEFTGETYGNILWQAACHYRAQQIGPKSVELMRLTGAKVQIVERCSAIDGTWGLRAENVDMARTIAKPLMEKVRESDADLIVGDCHLANTAISQDAGRTPVHPLQVIARAYGFSEE